MTLDGTLLVAGSVWIHGLVLTAWMRREAEEPSLVDAWPVLYRAAGFAPSRRRPQCYVGLFC